MHLLFISFSISSLWDSLWLAYFTLSQSSLKRFSFVFLFLKNSDWVVSIILSLIHFYVSPNLLLIHSSIFFQFQLLYFSVVTGSFFVFSSSLLKFSCCSSILFPTQLAFLLMLWIVYLENCGFGFIIYFFFCRGFGLSIESNSSAFSCCLTLSVWNSVKQLPNVILKGCRSLGVSCTVWIWHEHRSFQDVLLAVTLVGWGGCRRRG